MDCIPELLSMAGDLTFRHIACCTLTWSTGLQPPEEKPHQSKKTKPGLGNERCLDINDYANLNMHVGLLELERKDKQRLCALNGELN